MRAKLAALHGPIFCTNTAYFLTLRQWQREHLRRRRLLLVDEAHNLEAQLVRWGAWFAALTRWTCATEQLRVSLQPRGRIS